MKLAELINKYEAALHQTPSHQVQDCINAYMKDLAFLDKGSEVDVLDGLTTMRNSGDWHHAMFLLMAAEAHLSDRYRSVLCALLDMKDSSFPNEYAVEVLAPVADLSCLPVLTALVHHQFSGDPDRQIAIKAINAIANIDDPSATAFLKQISFSDDPRLAEEAGYLLSDN